MQNPGERLYCSNCDMKIDPTLSHRCKPIHLVRHIAILKSQLDFANAELTGLAGKLQSAKEEAKTATELAIKRGEGCRLALQKAFQQSITIDKLKADLLRSRSADKFALLDKDLNMHLQRIENLKADLREADALVSFWQDKYTQAYTRSKSADKFSLAVDMVEGLLARLRDIK